MKAELTDYLRELHLPTIRRCFEELARRAERETLSYEQYLLELVERECQERRAEPDRAAAAGVPAAAGEDAGELRPEAAAGEGGAPGADAAGRLVRGSAENVLAFGNPGSGKTHSAVGARARNWFARGRRVAFTTCGRLVQELLRAKRDLKLSRVLKKLAHYEVLMIDDLGYVQQSREEMEVLFTLLAERYERGSVMMTSNLPFSKWEAIFKDPMTTAAAIDRLVHHSVILELNIPSYRVEQAKKNEKRGGRMMARPTRKDVILEPGGSASRPPGFTAFLPSQAADRTGGAGYAAPALVWPRSQRSGCIPAEPYPLLRSAPV